MADFKKLTWMRDRLKTTSRVTSEDIDPGSGWANDPGSPFHQLLVNLPGWKKSDVKLQVDETTGTFTVSGGRRVSENRRVQFQKTFKAPLDSDIKSISMQFAGDTLEVSIPRVAKKMKEEPKIKNGAKNGASSSTDVKEEKEQKIRSGVLSSESEIKNGAKEAEEEKSEPEIKNGAPSGVMKEAKAGENESLEDEKAKEEPEIKNGGSGDDSEEEKREELERSEGIKEMNGQPESKNQASSNDIREEKREEFESLEEAREMKDESEFINGTPTKDIREDSDIREESERSKEAQATEEKGVTEKGVVSEKREESESSEETKKSKEDSDPKIGALSSESKSAKVAKENAQPETENRALNSELTREEKTDGMGNSKEDNGVKPDETRKENGQKASHNIKGDKESGQGNANANANALEKSVMAKIIENRSILLASIISFTLGVLMSQKFHKPPPPK